MGVHLDQGETSTLGGQTVSKNDNSIHLIGTLDELNSHLGLIRATLHEAKFPNCEAKHFVEEIQKNLMKMMSHISDVTNEKYHFHGEEINILEKETKRLSEKLPKELQFVIPGENIVEANIHIARTVARRAERMFYAANGQELFCQQAGIYLNRLSDYLFVLSRQFINL
jgi:cob(I)alamin adenosyltransferase